MIKFMIFIFNLYIYKHYLIPRAFYHYFTANNLRFINNLENNSKFPLINKINETIMLNN